MDSGAPQGPPSDHPDLTVDMTWGAQTAGTEFLASSAIAVGHIVPLWWAPVCPLPGLALLTGLSEPSDHRVLFPQRKSPSRPSRDGQSWLQPHSSPPGRAPRPGVCAASTPLGAAVHLHFWSRGTSQPRLDVASWPQTLVLALRRWSRPEPCPRTRKWGRPPCSLRTAAGARARAFPCRMVPCPPEQPPGSAQTQPHPHAQDLRHWPWDAFEQTLRDGHSPAWQLLTHIKAGAHGLCLVVRQAGGEGEAAAVCWGLAAPGSHVHRRRQNTFLSLSWNT